MLLHCVLWTLSLDDLWLKLKSFLEAGGIGFQDGRKKVSLQLIVAEVA